MARRDQPYLPLYVADFLTDERLRECSAESVGVYIMLMCVMHKSQDYGSILLKQKDKQNSEFCSSKNASKLSDFACKLARQLPYSTDTIERALEELVDEGVLTVDGDRLFQKRMVRDGELSDIRSKSGSKGGNSSKNSDTTSAESKQNDKQNSEFASDFAQAKTQANSENEIESDYVSESEDESLVNGDRVIGEEPSEVVTARYDRFEKFWAAYPNQTAYGAAKREFFRVDPDDGLLEVMLAALDKAKRSKRWHDDGGRYIPNPVRWLSEQRWLDDGIEPLQPERQEYTDYGDRNPFEQFDQKQGVAADG